MECLSFNNVFQTVGQLASVLHCPGIPWDTLTHNATDLLFRSHEFPFANSNSVDELGQKFLAGLT